MRHLLQKVKLWWARVIYTKLRVKAGRDCAKALSDYLKIYGRK